MCRCACFFLCINAAALRTYIQTTPDLIIRGQTLGIKEKLVDLYDKPELLFFGPDGASLLPSVFFLLCSTADIFLFMIFASPALGVGTCILNSSAAGIYPSPTHLL